ncbi:stage III sporulation protein AF [Paenibacillus sp. GD4]|uniref:stage III sporulation protein AF n=1 Tax=Paenibacillus sp. GD4 TaxID=3068890 RepID=UPI0027968EAD|nr:stage III sporulation protein AF [Paenibacillus sp. GD4]MDQ1909531.1 stage III sporulation protein AF [Paenibacillus sp. GD4]
MDWLSGWLKSIILVILLATFIDLLLPNQTMQRYVKTVMGLFILLTLLHPLFSLFQKNNQVEEMLAGALFKQDASNRSTFTLMAGSSPVTGQVESLPSIQQQAEALRAKQEQQAHHLVQQQAAEVIKRSIEQNLGVKVGQVQVETTTDASGNKVIGHVAVALDAEVKPQKKEGKAVPSEPIRPVQPVQIQIEPGAALPAKSKEAPAQQALEASAPELEQKRTQVVHLLRQNWQLQEKQVTVSWLDAKTKY